MNPPVRSTLSLFAVIVIFLLTSLSFADTITVTGNLLNANQVDLYNVHVGDGGGTVTFSFSGSFDAVFSLFDAVGHHLITNDDSPSDGINTDPKITQVLAAGDYTLAVTVCCNFANASNLNTTQGDGFNPGNYWIGGPGMLTDGFFNWGCDRNCGGAYSVFVSSPSVAVTGTSNPTIVANVSPVPNQSGWNNSTVAVHFVCNQLAVSCSPPVPVWQDGANQAVTGTATDINGNSVSVTATVNIEMPYDPYLEVDSPVDSSAVAAGPVTVSGSLQGSSSGLGSIACNGVAGSFTGNSFRCTVNEPLGNQTISVTSTDRAGNSDTYPIRVQVRSNRYSSQGTLLYIHPEIANLLVGESRQLQLFNVSGEITDAVWSVDHSDIADLSTDHPPLLNAKTAGTITVTATSNTVSASQTYQIFAGSELPMGTYKWATYPADYSLDFDKFVKAEPVQAGDPTFYASAIDNAGIAAPFIQAFDSEGKRNWVTPLSPGYNPVIVPHPDGGLVAIQQMFDNMGTTVTKFAPDGTKQWDYVSDRFLDTPAIHPNGDVYFVKWNDYFSSVSNAPQLIGLYGANGQQRFAVTLPLGTTNDLTDCAGSQPSQPGHDASVGPDYGTGTVPSAPIIAEDGNIYIETATENDHRQFTSFYTNQTINQQCGQDVAASYSRSVQLLKVTPDGTPTFTTLAQYQYSGPINRDSYYGYETLPVCSNHGTCNPTYFSPGPVLPNGSGGTLAIWSESGVNLNRKLAAALPSTLASRQITPRTTSRYLYLCPTTHLQTCWMAKRSSVTTARYS